MPDWVVHVTVAWILCLLLRFKYPEFNSGNTVLVMVGALLPDLVKVDILFNMMGHDWWDYIYILHLPIGTFLVTGIFSLFFREKKVAFLFFTLGFLSHYILDLLLIQVGPGVYLFYPVSWMGFHLDLIPADDYYITMIVLGVALVIYPLSKWIELKYLSKKTANLES